MARVFRVKGFKHAAHALLVDGTSTVTLRRNTAAPQRSFIDCTKNKRLFQVVIESKISAAAWSRSESSPGGGHSNERGIIEGSRIDGDIKAHVMASLPGPRVFLSSKKNIIARGTVIIASPASTTYLQLLPVRYASNSHPRLEYSTKGFYFGELKNDGKRISNACFRGRAECQSARACQTRSVQQRVWNTDL